MERSPKLISDSIDQVSPFGASLSLEKIELESIPWRQSRLYGLEFLSSSPHDTIRDLAEYLDKDEDVVLIEEASVVLLKYGVVLEVELDGDVGNEYSVLVVCNG